MDPRRFDAFARSLAATKSRRGFLGTLVAVGAGLLGARSADAQVTQAFCGNVLCAANPGVCKPGCICCGYVHPSTGQVVNSRCMPAANCTGGGIIVPPGSTTTAAPTTTTTTTPAPTTTTTTAAPTTTTTTTGAPSVCAGQSCGVACGDGCICATSFPNGTQGPPVCVSGLNLEFCGDLLCTSDFGCAEGFVCVDAAGCCSGASTRMCVTPCGAPTTTSTTAPPCVPDSDSFTCTNQGRNCGPTINNCGQPVASCGNCSGNETCCEGTCTTLGTVENCEFCGDECEATDVCVGNQCVACILDDFPCTSPGECCTGECFSNLCGPE